MPTDVPLTSVYRRNIRFFEDYEQTCSSLLGSHSPLHPHNSTSLLPAPLTSRPQPFRFTLGSPGMTNTAQAPHRRIQRNMSVPPINSMPLPGQREPHKRPRRLLTRYRHRTGAPKLVLIRMGGTQNRGEHHQGSAASTGAGACRCVSHAQGGEDVRPNQPGTSAAPQVTRTSPALGALEAGKRVAQTWTTLLHLAERACRLGSALSSSSQYGGGERR